MKYFAKIILFILAASILITSCYEDEECEPRPYNCETVPYDKGSLTFKVTINAENPSVTVRYRKGTAFENGTNEQSFTTFNQYHTVSNLDVGDYSAQVTYTYKGMTITATDSGDIDNDETSYCEGPCFTLDNGDIDLYFDTDEFEKYIGAEQDNYFIATAAFGSKLAPEVKLLRAFRDKYLMTNSPGRILTGAYYRISPPAAELISKNESLRSAARAMLYPVIFTVKNPAAGILIFLSLVTAPFVIIKIFRSGRGNR